MALDELFMIIGWMAIWSPALCWQLPASSAALQSLHWCVMLYFLLSHVLFWYAAAFHGVDCWPRATTAVNAYALYIYAKKYAYAQANTPSPREKIYGPIGFALVYIMAACAVAYRGESYVLLYAGGIKLWFVLVVTRVQLLTTVRTRLNFATITPRMHAIRAGAFAA